MKDERLEIGKKMLIELVENTDDLTVILYVYSFMKHLKKKAETVIGHGASIVTAEAKKS